jgi:GH43 family beta-xylosidase
MGQVPMQNDRWPILCAVCVTGTIGHVIRGSVAIYDVNEGPSVSRRNGRIFISYAASATDHHHAMGLLWAGGDADLLDPGSRTKSAQPVLRSCYDHGVDGPGHNSFTYAEDDDAVMLVHHARTHTGIVGDPLWNLDRHTSVKSLRRDEQGMPVFGRPSTY